MEAPVLISFVSTSLLLHTYPTVQDDYGYVLVPAGQAVGLAEGTPCVKYGLIPTCSTLPYYEEKGFGPTLLYHFKLANSSITLLVIRLTCA